MPPIVLPLVASAAGGGGGGQGTGAVAVTLTAAGPVSAAATPAPVAGSVAAGGGSPAALVALGLAASHPTSQQAPLDASEPTSARARPPLRGVAGIASSGTAASVGGGDALDAALSARQSYAGDAGSSTAAQTPRMQRPLSNATSAPLSARSSVGAGLAAAAGSPTSLLQQRQQQAAGFLASGGSSGSSAEDHPVGASASGLLRSARASSFAAAGNRSLSALGGASAPVATAASSFSDSEAAPRSSRADGGIRRLQAGIAAVPVGGLPGIGSQSSDPGK